VVLSALLFCFPIFVIMVVIRVLEALAYVIWWGQSLWAQGG